MAEPRHHGLEPGDILLGHRRAKTGPADWMTAAVIEAIQGTPYGHAAMYVGNGQVVHAHRTLPVAGVHRFSLEKFKELYDFKAYRVNAAHEVRQDAADFIKKKVGTPYSAAKMYGSLIPRSLGSKKEELEKRIETGKASEFMCSELIAAAYPTKVFAGQAIESTKPVDLAKANHTRLVAEFKKEASAFIAELLRLGELDGSA
jgi:uncharacterized protein YycO